MARPCKLAILIFTASWAVASPSFATTIPPDPLIGVRGGDGSSPSATDGSAFQLISCPPGDLTAMFCAEYENSSDNSIFFLDLSFWDINGSPIFVSSEPPNFFVSPFSDFQGLAIVDEHTVQLFCNDTELCSPSEIFSTLVPASFNDPPISSGAFVVFSNTPGFVSIQGVNGISNTNAVDPAAALPVPEPATLVLVGTGMVMLARRARANGIRKRPSP